MVARPPLQDLSRNLLSVNAITQNDGKVIFTKGKVQIMKNDEIIQGDKNKNGLYMVSLDVDSNNSRHTVEANDFVLVTIQRQNGTKGWVT